ncbi:MAG: hypothetical protein CMJ70_07625 [Planctomycetaceae bacterium]|nr:hypothetical protein [Planctomycetaceae bacterium]
MSLFHTQITPQPAPSSTMSSSSTFSERTTPRWLAMRPWSTCLLAALLGHLCGCNRAPETVDDVFTNLSPAEFEELRNSTPPKERPKPPGPALSIAPQFVDIASEAGIQFQYFNDEVEGRFFLPESMGGGAAWVDYDGDGCLDLYLVNGSSLQGPGSQSGDFVNHLFRNLGQQKFAEVGVTANGHHKGYGHAVAVGDFDADGFPDLYLTNFGTNTLLHNNGDGTFDDVTDTAGVGDPLWGFGGVWFDIDGDRDLDLFVVNYIDWSFQKSKTCDVNGQPVFCGPGEFSGLPDRLFINLGNGQFSESAKSFGFAGTVGKGLVALAADLDNDLQPELYVGNDLSPNLLYTRSRPAFLLQDSNSASTPFLEIAAAAGAAVDDQGYVEASMGIACGDFDRDGWSDLFLTHFYNHKNTLYRNHGQLRFQDVSKGTQIAQHSYHTLGFGTVTFDYDRDGWLDLFATNGHVLGPNYDPYAMTPQFFRNNGKGQFDDISKSAGTYFRQEWVGRGVAGGDYDNDGDLDLAISHLYKNTALLRNETATDGRPFLGLDLRTADRVPPVGGRVVVTAPNITITKLITAGGSYASTNDPRLLIGLSEAVTQVELDIYWPSGRVDHWSELGTNRYWLIIEGTEPQSVHTRD